MPFPLDLPSQKSSSRPEARIAFAILPVVAWRSTEEDRTSRSTSWVLPFPLLYDPARITSSPSSSAISRVASTNAARAPSIWSLDTGLCRSS